MSVRSGRPSNGYDHRQPRRLVVRAPPTVSMSSFVIARLVFLVIFVWGGRAVWRRRMQEKEDLRLTRDRDQAARLSGEAIRLIDGRLANGNPSLGTKAGFA